MSQLIALEREAEDFISTRLKNQKLQITECLVQSLSMEAALDKVHISNLLGNQYFFKFLCANNTVIFIQLCHSLLLTSTPDTCWKHKPM